jgi:hypothetical protein
VRRTLMVLVIGVVFGGSASASTLWVRAPMKARQGSFLATHGYCQYEDMIPFTVDYPGRRYRCMHIDQVHDILYSHSS